MNMKISKKAEYGLTAMVHLAKNKINKAVSIRQISNIEGVPFEFLSKIFNDLEKAKLVKSKRGANGGYYLARPANKITAGDVVLILEENIAVSHCKGCQMAGKCTSKDVWGEVQQSLDTTLNAVTLADLIKK